MLLFVASLTKKKVGRGCHFLRSSIGFVFGFFYHNIIEKIKTFQGLQRCRLLFGSPGKYFKTSKHPKLKLWKPRKVRIKTSKIKHPKLKPLEGLTFQISKSAPLGVGAALPAFVSPLRSPSGNISCPTPRS